MKRAAILVLSCLLISQDHVRSENVGDLQKLAQDFWNWRAQNAPFTGDDVNRMERPGGTRDWSARSDRKTPR